MARLPVWLQWVVAPWFAWLDLFVPRPVTVVGAGVAAAVGLVTLQWWYGVDELRWWEIAVLSTAHVWVPLLVFGPILVPYTLAAGLAFQVLKRCGRRAGIDRASSATGPDRGGAG
jgi:hypothetical protein